MAAGDPGPAGRDRLRWLGLAGGAALALAALLLGLALVGVRDERRAANDIAARADAMMNRIEAETARMERNAQGQ
jgi:type VI protein secretion system component VasK